MFEKKAGYPVSGSWISGGFLTPILSCLVQVQGAGEQRGEQDPEDEDVRLTQYQAPHRTLQLDRYRRLLDFKK